MTLNISGVRLPAI